MRVLNTMETQSVTGGCNGCLDSSFDYFARTVYGVPGVVLGSESGGYWEQQWQIWGPNRIGGYPR